VVFPKDVVIFIILGFWEHMIETLSISWENPQHEKKDCGMPAVCHL